MTNFDSMTVLDVHGDVNADCNERIWLQISDGQSLTHLDH